MSDSERDDELENFLRRRSPMHRRLSDFDHAEPSIELDRVVLNRAREAIETPKQPQMFRGSRWAMPAGLAATILIAFTLVLNVDHQARKVVSAPSQAAAAAVVEQAGSGSAELAAAPAAPALRQEKAVADKSAADSVSTAGNATPLVASNSATPPPIAPAAAESKAEAHADAESWLREIARLRAEGKNSDADREVVAFRRAYPSHAGTSVAQPPTR
jgi:hypothetical protein